MSVHNSPPHSPKHSTTNMPVHPTEQIRDLDNTCLKFQQLTCESYPHSPPHTPLGSVSNSEEISTHIDLSEKPEHLDSIESTPKRRSSVQLDLDKFKLIRTLGTGSFGRVHLAQSKLNDQYYAIKVLKKEDIVKLKQVEHTKNERAILKSVQYDFIVNLWGTFQDDANLYMVMDYVPGGELFTLLRKSVKLQEDYARFYAAEILITIEYLHSQDIIYRDLKPENILLDEKGHIKLTDFGFAKVVPDITWTLCGTPDYLAPEVIQSKGYGKPVDYWAFGVLIFEMLSGGAPFYDDNQFKLYENIVACKPDYPSHFSAEVVDLLKHLLTPDLSNRYGNLKNGTKDLMDHPWFQPIDFEKLRKKEVTAPYIPKLDGKGDSSNFDVYDEEKVSYGKSEPDPYRKYFTEF